jgi:hypothetical protein
MDLLKALIEISRLVQLDLKLSILRMLWWSSKSEHEIDKIQIKVQKDEKQPSLSPKTKKAAISSCSLRSLGLVYTKLAEQC